MSRVESGPQRTQGAHEPITLPTGIVRERQLLPARLQARLIQRKYGYIFPRLSRSTGALFPGNHLKRGSAPPLVDRNGVAATESRGRFGTAPRPDTDTLRRSAAQRHLDEQIEHIIGLRSERWALSKPQRARAGDSLSALNVSLLALHIS